ncbi:HTTM domain-containing protein [Smaragdicoccus niigatensis]|uniref:HTTM domain-containing protein n=1 Tax=Smaragdicoccus niigatensis TaxID=359359 RepID=UPI0003749DFF|nr:HTTM domain-containing protein [Smaragdicoccus niigatensis]
MTKTTNRVRGIAGAWRNFWFEPQSMMTLGLLRIVFGVVVFGWGLSLGPDLFDLFGRDGVMPEPISSPYLWGLLHVFPSDTAVVILWGLLLVAAAALTVGWHSRLAALVVLLIVLSFERRNMFVFNSGDVLLRIEALFLVLSPCGSALSLDRKRTAGSFWSAQMRAPWTLRLFQLQLSLVYLVSVQGKLAGGTWIDGTAVSYALRVSDLTTFSLPSWVINSPLFINFASWSTLVLEVALAILVWNKAARPKVLVLGVIMHVTILMSLAVAFFSFAIFVLYLSFLSPETAERWARKLFGWKIAERPIEVVDAKSGKRAKRSSEPVEELVGAASS